MLFRDVEVVETIWYFRKMDQYDHCEGQKMWLGNELHWMFSVNFIIKYCNAGGQSTCLAFYSASETSEFLRTTRSYNSEDRTVPETRATT